MFFFGGIEHDIFAELKYNRFQEMKKLNRPNTGKLNSAFSSAEITRIRKTENLNLKQKVNQNTTEVLPMLTEFVMRYNQPGSY